MSCEHCGRRTFWAKKATDGGPILLDMDPKNPVGLEVKESGPSAGKWAEVVYRLELRVDGGRSEKIAHRVGGPADHDGGSRLYRLHWQTCRYPGRVRA